MASGIADEDFLLEYLLKKKLQTKKTKKPSNIMKSYFRRKLEEDRDLDELIAARTGKDKKKDEKKTGIDPLAMACLLTLSQSGMMVAVLYFLLHIK